MGRLAAALAALQTFIALGFYVWTVFGLRTRYLRDAEALSKDELARRFPRRARLALLHRVLSPLVIVGALVGGAIFALRYVPSLIGYGVGALASVGAMIFLSGLFEAWTGVSPIYGWIIRRSGHQRYVCATEVHRLGRARIIVGLCVFCVVALLMMIERHTSFPVR